MVLFGCTSFQHPLCGKVYHGLLINQDTHHQTNNKREDRQQLTFHHHNNTGTVVYLTAIFFFCFFFFLWFLFLILLSHLLSNRFRRDFLHPMEEKHRGSKCLLSSTSSIPHLCVCQQYCNAFALYQKGEKRGIYGSGTAQTTLRGKQQDAINILRRLY